MFLISVFLHGTLLSIPMPSEPELIPEPEPEESVEIIQLSALTVRSPQPSPKPSAQPLPSATQPVAQRPQPQPVSPTAPPPVTATPSPTPEASPSPVAAAPEPQPSAPASAPADLAPPPEFDPTSQRTAFASSIQGDLGNLQPDPYMLENPEFYFVEPDNRDSEILPGISAMQWFNKKPDEVGTNLQANYGAEGYIFNEIPDGYGEGMLYELQTAEGQTFAYLNLAPGKGGASTIVVTWDFNPNEPPQ